MALRRWLRDADYKQDPVNAIFFLENQLEIYRQIEKGNDNFSIFGYAVVKEKPDLNNIKFLQTDESFKICNQNGGGIECGTHGHIGISGAHGGVTSFQKMGTRYNVGHSHSTTIKDGVYYAGVLGKLDMGYNQGSTNW